MKKLILLLVLLLSVPAQANISSWIWGDSEAVSARFGIPVTENNEAGLSFLWWPDDSEPKVLGLYGVHYFANSVPFRNPLILDFLPETFEGRPYIGAKLDVNFDTDDTAIGPVAGIIFEDVLFLEYQFQNFEQGSSSVDNKIVFGLRIKF